MTGIPIAFPFVKRLFGFFFRVGFPSAVERGHLVECSGFNAAVCVNTKHPALS